MKKRDETGMNGRKPEDTGRNSKKQGDKIKKKQGTKWEETG